MGDPVGHACSGAIQAHAGRSQGLVAVDFFPAVDWPVAICTNWAANDASMAR
jgi:hypothetical protein